MLFLFLANNEYIYSRWKRDAILINKYPVLKKHMQPVIFISRCTLSFERKIIFIVQSG